MEEIDVMQLLKMFWRKKIIIILCTIIGLVIGYAYNAFLTTPTYKATATFLLSNSVEAKNSEITTTDVTLNSKIINNYAELIKSDTILDDVISRLNVTVDKGNLKKNISVKVKEDTEVVELSVILPEKEKATVIANKIVEVLGEKVKDFYNMENIRIVDMAKVPTSPNNIKPTKYAIIGAAVGFAFACVVILIFNMFDDTVKLESDVESKTNLKVLATFRKQSNPDTFDWNPKLDYVESFKALRTNLQFSMDINEAQVIAVSSTFPEEGKSWVVKNLAMAFAKADYRVLIVDADLRKGVQHMKFHVEQRPGLSELLRNRRKPQDTVNWSKYVRETRIENIFLIPSGKNTFDSSELLLSNKLKKIINELRKGFDIVIFDSTPSALVADAAVLSRSVDTNIIVTEFEKTKIKDLKAMKRTIENVGGHISGVVINKVNSSKGKSYYYYGNEKSLTVSKRDKHNKNSIRYKAH